MTQLTATAAVGTVEEDERYADVERLVRDRVGRVAGPLFLTDASPDDLWGGYIENLPAGRQQHYNCHCCRRFIQRFGGLVTIKEDGNAEPLLWTVQHDDVPAMFRGSFGELYMRVRQAKTLGVFLWSEKERTWGTPSNQSRDGRTWTHLSGTPASAPFTNPILTAGQAIAAKKQDFQILVHSLADYSIDVVAQASRILNQDAVYRSEKAVGVATWFAKLHRAIEGVHGRRRDNIIWTAVATAPVGYCHVRSTVISTLLDDIKEEKPFEEIARRWKDKLHPLQYQRPTAAPSEGAIEAAEKLVEKLGVVRSLERRFATLDDVLVKLWIPAAAEPKQGGGVFDHLKAGKRASAIELPNSTMTWEKFQRTVLPSALAIEARTPANGPYYGLVTAVDPDAPPILQWDGLQGHGRNPVSWYFYNGGSTALQWNLAPNDWVHVKAVFLAPHAWQDPRFTHQGQNAFFALEGCWDKMGSKTGLALFPEILKAEFHGIRSVIEAHSKKGGIHGTEQGTANGIALQKSVPSSIVLRVRAADGVATYTLDRWD